MSLTRRELVALLGRTAAAGALWACGGRGGPATAGAPVEVELRSVLRDAVAAVRATWPEASGWAGQRARTHLLSATGGRGTTTEHLAVVTLRVADARGVIERTTHDVTPEAIARLAAELAAAGPGTGRTLDPGAPVDHVARPAQDPATLPAAGWLVALDAALARSERLGETRIVWRAAHAIVDDERRWFVGDGLDVLHRAARVRAGITMLAWSGNRPMIGEVVVGRAAGIEALGVTDDAIALAAGRALELLTPGDVPAGPSALVLDPSVVAAIVAAGIRDVVTTAAWGRPDLAARARLGQPVAAPAVTIVDDATAGGFAGHARDDEGAPARRVALVDGGTLAAVLADARGAAIAGVPRTGHGRRGLDDGAVAARATDVTMTAGAEPDDALLAAIGDGLVIETADGASVDPRTWQLVVRAARARRVARGKLTGHAWGDVEVRGEVPALLGAVSALGATTTTLTSLDGVATSVTAPAIATRGDVAPRRSR